MSAELLPCPFCKSDDVGIAKLKGYFCVQCACEANGPWKQTPERAVEFWNTRATQPQAPQGAVTPGFKLVPIEPTPEIIAAASLAVWPSASAADIDLSRRAAPIVLMQMEMSDGITVDMLAASLATMAPAYRAMVAAAPQSSEKEAEIPAVIGAGVLCSICGLGRHVACHRPLLDGPNKGAPLDHVFIINPVVSRDSTSPQEVALYGTGVLAAQLEQIALILRYPEEWDTAAYPTLVSAITEVRHAASCMATHAPRSKDIAAIRHTLMTGLAHNDAIAALNRWSEGRVSS